jgi:hypothetical protein
MINIPLIETGDRIPKIIHQTCNRDVLELDEIRENIENMRLLNPNWEHCLYLDEDIENFILEYYGLEILQIYQSISSAYGAARADFFRYLLVYAKGGVYLDIKCEITRSLDEVIFTDDCFILSKWNNKEEDNYPGWGMHEELSLFDGGEYQQWHVISVPGHPFLRELILKVISNIQEYNVFRDGVGKFAVLRATGPIAYTLKIESMKSLCGFRQVDIEKDLGIKYSIYDSMEHENLTKKHYTRLNSPLINRNIFRFYYEMLLYNFFKLIKKVVVRIVK